MRKRVKRYIYKQEFRNIAPTSVQGAAKSKHLKCDLTVKHLPIGKTHMEAFMVRKTEIRL